MEGPFADRDPTQHRDRLSKSEGNVKIKDRIAEASVKGETVPADSEKQKHKMRDIRDERYGRYKGLKADPCEKFISMIRWTNLCTCSCGLLSLVCAIALVSVTPWLLPYDSICGRMRERGQRSSDLMAPTPLIHCLMKFIRLGIGMAA